MTRRSSRRSPGGRGQRPSPRHRRLAAIAELVRRRADGPTDYARWSCDNWDAVAAELGAAQGISHGMASGQMHLGLALRDRLPQTAALFADGTISARLAATVVWHTDLIKDPETLGLVDKTLAEDVARYGPLSVNKTAQAIEGVVDRYDPGALRRTRATARSRDVVVDSADRAGAAAVWGRLYATDAAVLDRRLMQMAHGVCDDDPAHHRSAPRRCIGRAGRRSRPACLRLWKRGLPRRCRGHRTIKHCVGSCHRRHSGVER